jgi:hypothetical protein
MVWFLGADQVRVSILRIGFDAKKPARDGHVFHEGVLAIPSIFTSIGFCPVSCRNFTL